MTAVNKRFLYIRDSSYLHYTLSVNALPFKTVRIAHGLLFYNERMKRTETRPIQIGGVQIGGQNKVIIQSMTNTKTKDVEATVSQIKRLEEQTGKLIGENVQLENHVDKSLIGGVRVQVAGKIFDASLKRKLEDMRSRMQ